MIPYISGLFMAKHIPLFSNVQRVIICFLFYQRGKGDQKSDLGHFYGF
ncbi:hypothetical protein PEC301619_22640 [Pectobacterium carotovorum subsp. carotovorum]|nr:hypothetical protein PEC301619_22640 [Pectobacterium carotovorum subsp. carotovorum]